MCYATSNKEDMAKHRPLSALETPGCTVRDRVDDEGATAFLAESGSAFR